jgi:hypothetical protein
MREGRRKSEVSEKPMNSDKGKALLAATMGASLTAGTNMEPILQLHGPSLA